MKISVSSYSFQQYLSQGKMTLMDCIGKAKEMGFDAIEFIDLKGNTLREQKEEAKRLREEADRLGMEINAYTIGARLYAPNRKEQAAEVRRLKGQLEVAKLLGAKVMRHDVCHTLFPKGDGRSFDLMLPHLARNARKVTRHGAKLGIRTCSENHGRIAQDSDRVERLFHAVRHDNYGLLVDIGNFACVDEDSATAVSRVAPYAVHVHVKDFYKSPVPGEGFNIQTRGGNYLGGAAVGEGEIPVKKCLEILLKAGYQGYLSIEYEGKEDCMEGISRGLANLKAMLEEIQK